MSRKWKLTLPLCISAICVVLLGMTTSAQGPESRDTGNVVVITGVQAGINTCAYQAVSIYIRTDEPLYLAVTIIYDGQIVTDNVTSASYPDGIFTFAGLGYDNARGRAPVNLWPLTPGKKVKWFLTLFTADWEPVYEARSVANSCDATTLSSTTHGPAYQLMENHSFEAQGQVGGVLNPEAAMFWKRLNAANDSRVCSTPTPRGGSSNYVGECGFLFIADAGVKTKVKQKYTGTIGQSGDIDVYKRQPVPQGEEKWRPGEVQHDLRQHTQEVHRQTDAPGPVSYTHLDVYKRQRGCLPTPRPAASPACRGSSWSGSCPSPAGEDARAVSPPFRRHTRRAG